MPEIDLSRLTEPNSVENGVVVAAATATLALFEPRRLGVGGRLLYRGAIGTLTGLMMWTVLKSEDELGPSERIGLTAGGVGVALAFCEAGEALDGRMHDALVRRGVRTPRLVLAAMTGALSLGSWWLGTRLDDQEASSGPHEQ